MKITVIRRLEINGKFVEATAVGEFPDRIRYGLPDPVKRPPGSIAYLDDEKIEERTTALFRSLRLCASALKTPSA